ncbi:multimeric flavodoxin WrbA [Phyllobacterium trifolii]|jgi:multimeric flavodoxin WrbA|uniref:Multimeric flavodoxin WrbA n=1 Tax=Phyllobacterium trifolii TaxID=300193 RepID=A0A839UDN5_9HYPH|nr:NAD(P)H-dependent oxidoreductase [Phyllobacterium trifolii]MBB3148627.1 multimeric flavodoxin WrbA [Phyllobacterium trifolii]
MLDLVIEAFKGLDITTSSVRLAQLNIKPGVTSDEGDGDDWPALRKQIMDADILILGTPGDLI